MPIFTKRHTLGADCESSCGSPHCTFSCPTHALTFGDASDPDSDLSKRADELRGKGYRVYELPSYEESRPGILYAQRVG